MVVTVNKEELLKVIRYMRTYILDRPDGYVTISADVSLMHIEFSGDISFRSSLSAEVESAGCCITPCDKLLKILASVKSKEVVFKKSDGGAFLEALLPSGSSAVFKLNFPLRLDAKEILEAPDDAFSSVPLEYMRGIIGRAMPFIPYKDDDRCNHLRGANFNFDGEKCVISATNGTAMVSIEDFEGRFTCKESFTAPYKILKAFMALRGGGDVLWSVSSGRFYFKTDDCLMSEKIVDVKWPVFNITTGGKDALVIPSLPVESFKEAIGALEFKVSKRDKRVRLIVWGSSIEIQSLDGEASCSYHDVICGSEVRRCVNLYSLKEFFKSCPERFFEITLPTDIKQPIKLSSRGEQGYTLFMAYCRDD